MVNHKIKDTDPSQQIFGLVHPTVVNFDILTNALRKVVKKGRALLWRRRGGGGAEEGAREETLRGRMVNGQRPAGLNFSILRNSLGWCRTG